MRPRPNPGSHGTPADDSTRSDCSTAHRGSETDDCPDDRGIELVQRRRVEFVQCGCLELSKLLGGRSNDGSDRCGDNRGFVVQRSLVQRRFVRCVFQRCRETYGCTYRSAGEMRQTAQHADGYCRSDWLG